MPCPKKYGDPSKATLAFTSALCRFRCIWFLLLVFSLADTAILSYDPVQFLGDIILKQGLTLLGISAPEKM